MEFCQDSAGDIENPAPSGEYNHGKRYCLNPTFPELKIIGHGAAPNDQAWQVLRSFARRA
jgi:hypothetical protein